jgi:hypothetical protein
MTAKSEKCFIDSHFSSWVICEGCHGSVPAAEAPNDKKIVMKCEQRMILKETALGNFPGQAKDSTLIGYPDNPVEIRNGYLLNAILQCYHHKKLRSINFFKLVPW